jgi:hypothetical protein
VLPGVPKQCQMGQKNGAIAWDIEGQRDLVKASRKRCMEHEARRANSAVFGASGCNGVHHVLAVVEGADLPVVENGDAHIKRRTTAFKRASNAQSSHTIPHKHK